MITKQQANLIRELAQTYAKASATHVLAQSVQGKSNPVAAQKLSEARVALLQAIDNVTEK